MAAPITVTLIPSKFVLDLSAGRNLHDLGNDILEEELSLRYSKKFIKVDIVGESRAIESCKSLDERDRVRTAGYLGALAFNNHNLSFNISSLKLHQRNIQKIGSVKNSNAGTVRVEISQSRLKSNTLKATYPDGVVRDLCVHAAQCKYGQHHAATAISQLIRCIMAPCPNVVWKAFTYGNPTRDRDNVSFLVIPDSFIQKIREVIYIAFGVSENDSELMDVTISNDVPNAMRNVLNEFRKLDSRITRREYMMEAAEEGIHDDFTDQRFREWMRMTSNAIDNGLGNAEIDDEDITNENKPLYPRSLEMDFMEGVQEENGDEEELPEQKKGKPVTRRSVRGHGRGSKNK